MPGISARPAVGTRPETLPMARSPRGRPTPDAVALLVPRVASREAPKDGAAFVASGVETEASKGQATRREASEKR